MGNVIYNIEAGNATSILLDVAPGNKISSLYNINPGNKASPLYNVNPGNKALSLYDVNPGNKSYVGFKVSAYRATELSYEITEVPYYIAGTVTNSGEPVEGAKVYLIDEKDNEVSAITQTDGNGEYKFDGIKGDRTYHVAVSWEDEQGNKYNAESKPYISPVS